MYFPYKVLLLLLALVLSFTSLFLSSWIVLPAPNMSLLRLGVGAPEISPWLFIFNLVTLLLSYFWVYQYKLKYVACICSLIGLLICGALLINIPKAEAQMAQAMAEGLGKDYLEKIPGEISSKMRTNPFSLATIISGIPIGKTRQKTDIIFASPSGVDLKMNIYQPTQVGKYPALVVIYGGAWQGGNPRAHADFSQYMASQGYTVFAIAYRHAPKYRFPAQLEDVTAALKFIHSHAAEYEADAERMVVLGRSAGGHLATLATYQPDAPPIRGVVSYYGPVNLTQGYKEPPNPDPINSRAVLRTFIGGTPEEFPQAYKDASPINYAGNSVPPTLLVYGSRDHLVKVEFGRRLKQRLRESGNTAVLLEIPWAEHAFDSIFNGVSNQLALYYVERFIAWAVMK